MVDVNLGREMLVARSAEGGGRAQPGARRLERGSACVVHPPAAGSSRSTQPTAPRRGRRCVSSAASPRAKCIVHAHVGFDAEWMRATLPVRDSRRRRAHRDLRVRRRHIARRRLRPAVDLRRLERHRARALAARHVAATPSADELAIDDTTPVVLTVCRLFRCQRRGRADSRRCTTSSDEVPIRGAPRRRRGRRNRTISTSSRAWSRAYDLDDRVRFLGRRDDVPALMAAADVFAMPSHVRAVRLGLRRGHGDGAAGRGARQRRDGRGRRARCDRACCRRPGTATRSPPTCAFCCSTPDTRARVRQAGARRVERLFTTQADGRRHGERLRRRARSTRKIGPVLWYRLVRNRRRWNPRGVGMQGTVGIDADEFAKALDHDGYIVIRDVVSKATDWPRSPTSCSRRSIGR